MNLLLLLSALLSALSGVSTPAPVRAPVAASQKVRLAAVRAAATVRVAQWPVPPFFPGTAAVARAPLAASIAAAPGIAFLLTNRRRE